MPLGQIRSCRPLIFIPNSYYISARTVSRIAFLAARSTQTAPATEPKADLFKPAKPVTELPGLASGEAPPIQTPSGPTPAQPAKEPAEPAGTTTTRLLEAKRRAQRRKP